MGMDVGNRDAGKQREELKREALEEGEEIQAGERENTELSEEQMSRGGLGKNGQESRLNTPAPSESNGSKAEKVKTRATIKEQPPKPSKLAALKAKVGLDLGVLMMMFKGSVAPIIATAFYQSDRIASTYTSLGYLVPIICVLTVPIMPRAKFIQTVLLNIVGICAGSAVSLLGIWTGVKARENTTPTRSREVYNSSQAAVCAVWLFATIWFVNVLRAKFPALQFPVIMFSIFTNVAFTFGPLFHTIAQGEALVKQLLEGFLTAFAISTGVNLFIIPVTSRKVVFGQFGAYIMAIRATLGAQTAYLQSLESSDMFAPVAAASNDDGGDGSKGANTESSSALNPEAKALKAAVAGLAALHGKLLGDIPFAKREIAWGKLDAKAISEIYELLRQILVPLIGMSTITDIFERIAVRRGWVKAADAQHGRAQEWEHEDPEDKEKAKEIWNEVMKTLHEPFSIAVAAMQDGMEHAGLVLELLPKPKKKKVDEEDRGTEPRPGEPEFAKLLRRKVLDFYKQRGKALQAWASQKGLSEDQFDAANHKELSVEDNLPEEAKHRRDQQQLYLILYMEHLLYSTGVAVLMLVNFADLKVSNGAMSKNRLILPGQRRLKKWILSVGREDSSADHESPDSMESGSHNVRMGPGYSPKKDPEHLPPKNAWERFGNGIRTIPGFLGSTESAFGFRVACATLTVGILAYLERTQAFFQTQRLVWAMIIIAIGMTMTSGQSVFGFFGRVTGTVLAMVFSFAIWYIPNQHTAGVIVILWLFIFIEMYFFVKFPRFVPVWLVCIVTQVLIIGYELQVRKIGIRASSATGQPYYPIYELAPYRLACVAGGSAVAFIWTVFPYPLSDRSWLRKDLGATLYLLASYYSLVHSTIGARVKGTEGDMEKKGSPGRRLEKARHDIFGKLMLLFPSLKMHSDWQKWEPSIGGKWPRETYDAITMRASNILNYLSLISYATQSWSQSHPSASLALALTLSPQTATQATAATASPAVSSSSPPPSTSTSSPSIPNPNHASSHPDTTWLDLLRPLLTSPTLLPHTHQFTSTLILLSSSILNGSSLPPYIPLPPPYNLTRRLEELDRGVLDARHITEPGYAAYAVLQVASSLLADDLEVLTLKVKGLVGVVGLVGEDRGEIGDGKGKMD